MFRPSHTAIAVALALLAAPVAFAAAPTPGNTPPPQPTFDALWRSITQNRGCPVTTTALETSGTSPEIRRVCAAAFESWQAAVHDKLRTSGIPDPDARELAATVINTLGGAEVSAQVLRDDKPLRIAGRHLARLIGSYR